MSVADHFFDLVGDFARFARESERGVVDLETLRQTNQSLIQTLDEVVKIQDEGRQKRREAEAEIGRLEGELKQKLLDIHT